MRFGILGPLQIADGERPVPLTGRNLRALLATLLAQANQAVSIDALVEAVWGSAPPRTAVKNIQVYVHQLRRVVGESRILRFPHGYGVEVAPDELDAMVFEDRAAQGRSAIAQGDVQRGRLLLRKALRLRRGPTLADLSEVAALRDTILRLEERFLGVLEDRVDADLLLGDHYEVVAELHSLLAQHPLRERLRGQLMTALFRAGRQAQALDVYREGRRLLVDELGVEPSAELQRIHLAILRGADPSPVPVSQDSAPRHLPAPVNDFVGRAGAAKWLDECHNVGAGLVVICGGPGVGKTALAVRWANQVAETFDGGQLYVNLNGWGEGGPMAPIDALSLFLRALGVAPPDVPVRVDEASAMLRSLTVGRKMLILLDNAAHAEQVRPLLPGGGQSIVVVTSRDKLGGLVAMQGARRLELGVLDGEEARELVGRSLEGTDIGVDATSIGALAGLCAHLPLALRIATANLADREYGHLRELIAELRAEGWPHVLGIAGDPQAQVSVAFGHSFARLDPASRELFPLLALMPGPTFTAETARALAGQQRADGLHRLAGAHLLQEPLPGRFSFHDLLRRYALDLPLGIQDRRAALDRLYSHYLRWTDGAARLIAPQALRLPGQRDFHPFADQGQALSWVDSELPNLVAVVRRAPHDGFPEVSWQLVDLLRGYLVIRRYMATWIELSQVGLVAAESAGDGFGQVPSALSLSTALWWQGRRQEAVDVLTSAVVVAREVGWVEGEASCLGNLGAIHGDWGKLAIAAEHFAAAAKAQEQVGAASPVMANHLINLGAVSADLGRLRDAVSYARQALELCQSINASVNAAIATCNLGEALLDQGNPGEARALLLESLDVFTQAGASYSEACALVALGRASWALGERREATDYAHRAIEVGTNAGANNCVAAARGLLGAVNADVELHHQAIAEASGLALVEARLRLGLAGTLRSLGQAEQAKQHCQEVLSKARDGGFRLMQAHALAGLGRAEEARELYDECGFLPEGKPITF